MRLREVAKLPGLGFREAIQGSIRLQAVKLNAQLSERALASFGNALATVGKGKADLDGVTLALTQIVSKGKVSAEEINQIAERVPQIREAMKAAFGTADTEVLQKQNLAPEKFIEGIVAQLEKLPQASGGAQNAWENFTDSFDQAMVTLGGPLLAPLTQALDLISPQLQGIAQNVLQFFGQIPQMASSLIASLPDSFKNAFSIIVGIVQSVGAQIVGWFTQNLPLIKQTVTTILTAIGDFWAAWGGTIKTIVQTAMNVILGVIKTVMQVINGDWKGAWETLKTVLVGVLQNIPAIIGGLFSFVLQAAFKLGSFIVKGIYQGIVGLPERLVALIKAGLQALWNLGGWLLSEGYKLGAAIVTGIWQGIKSLFGGVTAKFQAELQGMVNGAKATLQSQSPSEVFAKIGRSIPEGLAQGITSGISLVGESMEKMLDAAIKQFSPKLKAKASLKELTDSILDALKGQLDALKEMRGGETALEKINKLLSDPRVAQMVGQRTAALLRFNAVMQDTLKLSRERFVDEERWRDANPALRSRDRIVDEDAWRWGNPNQRGRDRIVDPDRFNENNPANQTRPRRVLSDLVAEARERAAQIADDLTYHIGGAFRDLLDRGWRGLLDGMLDTAKNIFAQIADELINQLLRGMLGANQQGQSGGIVGMLTGLVSGLLGGLTGGNSTTSPSGQAVPNWVFGFANGGSVNAGQWAMVGERGPELVKFGSQARVFSNDDSRKMVGGGVTNVTNIINVPVARSSGYSQPKSRRQLAEDILGKLR